MQEIKITKILTIIILFVTLDSACQTYSGALKITVREKTKSAERNSLVINESITIVLNDSTKHSLITNSEGDVPIKNLQPGKYNIKIIRRDCEISEVKGIVIGKGKTAYVSITLTCQAYINSLTKKEKKKLGYK